MLCNCVYLLDKTSKKAFVTHKGYFSLAYNVYIPTLLRVNLKLSLVAVQAHFL